MMEFLEKWVLNIVVLTIFIVLLEILIPSGKTRKFVNLISGFILIIALINPVLSLLGKKYDFNEFEISSGNFLDRREIEEKSRLYNEIQMREIIEVYRQKLIKQMEDISEKLAGEGRVKADVIINEDYSSENFGEIKRVYLYISETEEGDGVKPVARVEKVEISDGKSIDKSIREVDRDLRKSLEDAVGRLFQVDSENIVISLK